MEYLKEFTNKLTPDLFLIFFITWKKKLTKMQSVFEGENNFNLL